MIPILNIISRRSQQDRQKAIEKLYLSGQHLGPRELDIEPFRAVDFRKALPSTASGRPFDIEGIAGQRRRVKAALAGECDDALPSSLSDFPKLLEWTNRSARAEFLGKLAPRDLLRSIRGIDFALWNGPGAIILLTPERTARMNEQNLEPASAFAVGENARAQGRSPGSLFHRSHVASILQSNRDM
jgi:hypothetical protein